MPEGGRLLKKHERERTRAVGDTPTACGVLLETGGEGGYLVAFSQQSTSADEPMSSKRRWSKMKKVILFALVLAVHGVLLNSVLAQQPAQRYVVTYISSQTGKGIRSATAVTVLNQSRDTCEVQVAWFLSSGLTTIGTSSASVSGRNSVQFCSRDLPDSITQCDSISSPELDSATAVQGIAIVISDKGDPDSCSFLAIEARVYYTTGDYDTAISAISNSKIVFAGEGNLGD